MKATIFLIALFILFMDSAKAQFKEETAKRVSNPQFDSLELVDSVRNYWEYQHHDNFLYNRIVGGCTLGTPGGINGIVGGYYDHAALRFEAGVTPLILVNLIGAQMDFGYVLIRGSEGLVELTAIYSASWSSSMDDPNGSSWSGIGAGLTVDLGGFFVQASVGHTMGTHSEISAVPMTVQVGYLH